MTKDELEIKIVESEVSTMKMISKMLDTIEIITKRIYLLNKEVKSLKESEKTWRRI